MVYQNLQAAREQIHLLLCFFTMKCRLSFPALPRVVAAPSLSVCLNQCGPVISQSRSALLFFIFSFFLCLYHFVIDISFLLLGGVML